MTALRRDAPVVLGVFVLLGVVGGLVWWQVTPLALWTRTPTNGSMDQLQMARSVAVDGWFFAIALAGGLLGGTLFALWRTRDPIATVVLVAAGACAASAVMFCTGHLLGPGDLDAALRHAKVGQQVPSRLTPQAQGVFLAWPVGALLAALAVLWTARDEPTAA